MNGRRFRPGVEADLPWCYAHLHTPDFTITNPALRPSWRPSREPTRRSYREYRDWLKRTGRKEITAL